MSHYLFIDRLGFELNPSPIIRCATVSTHTAFTLLLRDKMQHKQVDY